MWNLIPDSEPYICSPGQAAASSEIGCSTTSLLELSNSKNIPERYSATAA